MTVLAVGAVRPKGGRKGARRALRAEPMFKACARRRQTRGAGTTLDRTVQLHRSDLIPSHIAQ